jgi:outer membrane receptor protein involved in Fe transport
MMRGNPVNRFPGLQTALFTAIKSLQRPATTSLGASAALLVTGLAAATDVRAQAPGAIEEVVVYSQRREQSAQDVPITLSAIEGDFLNRTGIVELDALSDLTPGLVIQEQSPNNPGFVIRGITSDSGNSQATPRVSVYYNGVDVSRSRGSYFELYDIERVEVVKGPQATLFGTASSVGAVSVYTNKPQQELAGMLTASVGNYAATELRGFITGGNDLVQARLAASFRERDGFIDNIAGSDRSQNPGGLRQDDMQAIERTSFRPSIRFTPSDTVTIDLVYTYEENKDSGTSFKSGIFAPTGGSTNPYSFVEMAGAPDSAQTLGAAALGIDREVEDLNLRVEWAINDSLTLTSITAGRSFESLEIFDADGTQAWWLEFAEDAEGDQFSQELRLVGTTDRFTYIVGANYFEEDGSQGVPFSTEESIYLNCAGVLADFIPANCINPDGSVPLLTPVLAAAVGADFDVLPYQSTFTNFGENTIYSFFADVTYAVNDRLEIAAGARYVSEDRTSGFSATAPNSTILTFLGAPQPLLPGLVDTAGTVVEASDTFSDVLPRFNALYRFTDEINGYVTISKGRRADVIDVVATRDAAGNPVADVTDVPEEIVWNYETGVKGVAANNRISYNASVFYQDYSDFQVTLQDDAGNFFTANAGSATNIGVEADIRALLGSSFEVFANVAYIEAEIDNDSDNGDLAGNRFRLQPEWTTSAGVFYNTPLVGDIGLTGSIIYSYRTDVFFEPENAPIAGLEIAEDDYGLLNLRLGIENQAQGWSIIAFANNALDEEYLVDAGNTGGSFGNPTFVAGPPAFYGVQLNYAFGQ